MQVSFKLLNMQDLRAKNQWTGIWTIFGLQWTKKGAENITCINTLRLSDFESQASKQLFLRQHESTNGHFLFFSQPIKNEDIHQPKNN